MTASLLGFSMFFTHLAAWPCAPHATHAAAHASATTTPNHQMTCLGSISVADQQPVC
jgi:hypothetical protein